MNTNECKQHLKDLDPKSKKNILIALNLYNHLTGAPMYNLRHTLKSANKKDLKYLKQLMDKMDEIKNLVKEKE